MISPRRPMGPPAIFPLGNVVLQKFPLVKDPLKQHPEQKIKRQSKPYVQRGEARAERRQLIQHHGQLGRRSNAQKKPCQNQNGREQGEHVKRAVARAGEGLQANLRQKDGQNQQSSEEFVTPSNLGRRGARIYTIRNRVGLYPVFFRKYWEK